MIVLKLRRQLRPMVTKAKSAGAGRRPDSPEISLQKVHKNFDLSSDLKEETCKACTPFSVYLRDIRPHLANPDYPDHP
jgi:hypothetical protein